MKKMGYKSYFIILLVLSVHFAHAKTGDTIRVFSHNKTTVVTDQQKGTKAYAHWAKFPEAKQPVRKITLRVTLGCPDTMRCADWDYMDRISILRQGGKNGKNYNYEIGRMLTPYGGAFGKNWQFGWEIDITDFSLLLRDSVEIEYRHNGWEPSADRGWAVTVAFEIIEGPPAFEPLSITPVYDDQFAYGDPNKPINENLKAYSFTALKQADFGRLRVVQTGHGMDAPDNCSEFCDKYREIYFDGRLIDKRNRWKKCGDNPLYPQAGTWLIDRANWCPGDLINPEIFDLELQAGKSHTIKASMQNYVSTKPGALEVISAYLIQYKKPANVLDAAVKTIEAPTNNDAYRRKNPTTSNPEIVITNNGSAAIRTLEIAYGTKGFTSHKHIWNGLLAPRLSTNVVLPGPVESTSGLNQFMVNIQKVNGKKDQYPLDNACYSSFEAAPVHTGKMIIFLHTNNQPQHNGYSLKNSADKTVIERLPGSLHASFIYRDSLTLAPGNYQFELTDTAGDGLEFWFNNRGGRGLIRLETADGKILKVFESDFGNSLLYNFKVSENAHEWTTINSAPSVGLYPTRTSGKTTLDFFNGEEKDVLVKIVTDPGNTVVEEHVYKNLKSGLFQYDLSYRPPQRYYLQVYINQKLIFNKRIRVEEPRN